MYTVKQVASLTGVAEATLRVWERRYGVVQPERSAGGYRQYTDQQVAILREMAGLVDSGVPASRAAGILRAVESLPAAGGESVEQAGRPVAGDSLVAAAESLDPARMAAVLGAAFASAPFEQIADAWVLAQLDELGQAWESGRLSVAQEHFASAALMRAIAGVFEAATVPAGAPVVLVGLPCGDRHELALFSFATCLRRQGVDVVYLGADVPTDEWEQAAAQRRARVAVIGVTSDAAVADAQQVIDRLTALRPPVAVWVGGSRRNRVESARALPDSVAEAAGRLHTNLSAGAV